MESQLRYVKIEKYQVRAKTISTLKNAAYTYLTCYLKPGLNMLGSALINLT